MVKITIKKKKIKLYNIYFLARETFFWKTREKSINLPSSTKLHNKNRGENYCEIF